MNRSNLSLGDKARLIRNRAAFGATALVASVPAFAQVDTASIVTEIGTAKTAGMAVLTAMILAGLAFKAWKLLKRA